MSISRGRGGAGGGGSANRGAPIFKAGENDEGIFVSHKDVDYGWALRGLGRRGAASRVTSKITIPDANGDDLVVTLPTNWAIEPEEANDANIDYNYFDNPVSEIKAFYNYGPMRITSQRAGTAGQNDVINIIRGTGATESVNADAAIELSTGELVVVSPDATGTVDEVAGVNPRYGNNAAFMNVRALVPGTAMNGFTLAMRSVRDNSQTETITWSATYSSDNRTLNIVATLNTFDLFTVSTEGLVDAINAARTAQGEQLVEADRVPFGQDGFITINYIRSNDNPLRNINGLVFAGGTHASGPGTPTNRGEVRVVASAARVPGTAATYVWQISSGRQITLTFHQIGTGGNNLQFSIRQDTTNLNANTVDVTDSGADFLVRYNGSVTLGTLVDAMNGAGSRFTVAITQGSRADSVTPSGNISWRTSGGTDTVNPLSAVWDEDAHRLTITALTTDTAAAVSAAIVALDEFTSASVSYTNGGSDSATILVSSTVGEHTDYGFSGGTDLVPRTPLSVSTSGISGNGYIYIRGLIATDTVAEVAALLRSSRFTITATPGDDLTDAIGNLPAVSNANPANGRNAVSRRLPVVLLNSDTGVVRISLHARTGRSDNTTTAELATAFDSSTYVNKSGVIVDFPNANIANAGSAAVDVSALPSSPAGGINGRPADPVTASLDYDAKIINVRYTPGTDDAGTVLDALAQQGVVNVVLMRGTGRTDTLEGVPFTRDTYIPPSGGTASLTKSSLYPAVKAILHPDDQDAVSADDTNKEIDITGGSAASTFGSLSDTPSVYVHDSYVRVKAGRDELEYHDLGREVAGAQRVLELYGRYLSGLGLSASRTFRTIAIEDQGWFRLNATTNNNPSNLALNSFGFANHGLTANRATYIGIEVAKGWLPSAVMLRRTGTPQVDYPGAGQHWEPVTISGAHPYADYYYLADSNNDMVNVQTSESGQTIFMRLASLQLEPVTVKYWRDNSANAAVPSDADTIEVWPGRGTYEVNFGGSAADRRIHFALPEDYSLSSVIVESRGKLSAFTSRTVSGERIYDSGQLGTGLTDFEMLISIT